MNALTTMFSISVLNIMKNNSMTKIGASMAPWVSLETQMPFW